MADQLTFDLPVRPALGRGDFFVSPANAVAVAQVEGWGDWPQGKLVLCGPAGSGKTHLAHVWAALSGARIASVQDLSEAALPRLAAAPLVVEDAQRVAGDPALERSLFHLHNMALAAGSALLLTARDAPSRWGIALPDLRSRMEGTNVTRLDAPDDALLSAVLVKQFADRQIDIDPRVIQFLAPRIERDFERLGALVSALDRAALARQSPITVPLARAVLDSLDRGAE
ncbi:HdaA/DnaA family protein [Anianabacter salinae]|uniref:HdaA/DnaA family protein n=1 Tax=Anianabacter salinae TaxID=2851023 RepID=UPI00225E2396|nr:DnaA/Hda family protein [Anianabacter salinae]MBV0913916.1 chromosomal replication initiator DnaA [Anianabacter salinae]